MFCVCVVLVFKERKLQVFQLENYYLSFPLYFPPLNMTDKFQSYKISTHILSVQK